ncbi:MAG: hypothetical protein KME15_16970 [Drouetiella hepatica Uher 2000/2452]|uniref:Uncharacterized protein n=1 Tax=Drouetiella hepatica Uher 2000/2452 TaxID=904376 RepID=A0A951UQF4_9CYAN|nr:hypothetical protein [Drouetiella hepatica Uher 2000/2452]
MANDSPPNQPHKRSYPVVLLLIGLGTIGGCVALSRWLPSGSGCYVLNWQTWTWVAQETCSPSNRDL